MGNRTTRGLLLAAGFAFVAAGSAGAETKVASKIKYHPQSGASNAVKEQCALDTKIPEIFAASIPEVSTGSGGSQRLELLIRDVHAPPAGFLSGPKWVTIHGTLKKGGKDVGSFRAKRSTIMGTGNCNMLERCVAAIADDVGGWLASPTKDARLGNAK